MTSTEPAAQNPTAAAVRAWARGMHPTVAGVELLIRAGHIGPNAPWVTLYTDRGHAEPFATVDADALLEHTGGYSGGEKRLIRIAASLLGGPPVDLSEDIPGLERHTLDLVLAALAHAQGSHENGVPIYDAGGQWTGKFAPPSSLHPWPA